MENKINKSISVVMAGYNEEKNVKKAVEDTLRVLESSFEDYELILVNDCSKDNTGILMKELSEQNSKIVFIDNEVNLNFGASVVKGMKVASKDYVIYNAFDLPLKVQDIPTIIKEMIEKDSDVMVLQRTGYKTTFWRKITSLGNKVMLKVLFPILTCRTPVLNFVQVFKKKVVPNVIPMATSPIFVWPEMVFRAKKLKYKVHNRKTACDVQEVRKGSFGKAKDIKWGMKDMFKFRWYSWFHKIKKVEENKKSK